MATVAVTPEQNIVTGEIFIAAPPARVFEAITDTKQMPRWWGSGEQYRVTDTTADLRVGGKWSSDGIGKDGVRFHIDGEYLEIDPPRLLVYTWNASWGHPIATVVRWELEPQSVHGLHPNGPQRAGTGTLLKIRQEGFANDAAAAAAHGEGWKKVMGWLLAFVEKGETVENRKP